MSCKAPWSAFGEPSKQPSLLDPDISPPPVEADTKSEDGLTIPTNEAQAVNSIRPTGETKRINLGFTDERKTAIISSSLDDK
jgi:hypothetical protein